MAAQTGGTGTETGRHGCDETEKEPGGHYEKTQHWYEITHPPGLRRKKMRWG